MSVRVMSWVWDHSRSTATKLLVLLAIADWADDRGYAWPSVRTLAQKTRQDERTIQRAINELIELGELRVGRGAGPKGSNMYQVVTTGSDANPRQDVTPGSLPPRQPATPEGGSVPPTPRQPATPGGGSVPPNTSVDTPQNHQEHTTTAFEPPPVLFDPAAPPRRKASPVADDPLFDEFWRTYPRRVGKDDARRAWAGTRSKLGAAQRADPRHIIAAAARYRDDPNRVDQFTAHPATWLNQGRWDDDPLPARDGLVERNGMRVRPETAQRLDDQQRWEAMDAALEQGAAPAIGGAR